MTNTPCPPGADLLRLVRGELAARDADVLEQHLSQCSDCFEKCKSLDAQGGTTAVRCHQGATPSESENPGPEAKALIQRICALLPPAAPLGDAGAAVAGPQHDGGLILTVDVPGDKRGCNFIGPYKLLQKLGEGGMGTVYMAEQEHPIKRRVALKVSKEGLDSAHVLARFEAERQALSMMDHPNIARVLDVGAAADGRSYFVMDLVKGISITRYCDQERLTPAERLALFVPVCQAVQHAHQKGIIHRDLKPSNVLVALYDGKPAPKVIDFGVAKATGPKLTDRTMFTEVGQIVGTLEYMSPEQAELNQLDIDTRSDIYALGVLLYELLTGSPPFTGKELRSAGITEMLRMIREVEPPKPSTRLSSSDALPAIAAKRKLEPKRLTNVVQGELDWIVMKCLEKERGRRYQTATGLAEDVQRFLAGEPVLAVPPSAAYRLRKLAWKHRTAFTTVAGIILLLVAGIAASTWQAIRATQAEAKAQTRLAQLETGNEILLSIFADLDIRKVNQGTEPLQTVLAGNLVKAARSLEGEAVGDPLVVASLQHQLGLTLLNLGYPREAIGLFEKASETRRANLGADDGATLGSTANLAWGYQEAGKLDLALPLYETTLERMKIKLGDNDPATLRAMNNFGLACDMAGKRERAVQIWEETLKIRKVLLGPTSTDTLGSMQNLALGYYHAGKLQKALALWKQTLALMKTHLGPDHPDTLICMNNLALAYHANEQRYEALQLWEENLKLRKDRLGASHRDTLLSMSNLGLAYHADKQLDAALKLFEEALPLMKAKLGPDDRTTLATMNNLALVYQDLDKLDQAIELNRQTLKLRKDKWGPTDRDTVVSMNNLAECYQAAKKLDQALLLFEEAAAGVEGMSFQHENAGALVNNLIACYDQLKQFDQSEVWLRKWLAVVKEKSGAKSVPCAEELTALGLNLLQQEKWTKSESVLSESLAILEIKQADVWSTFNAQSLLGAALLGQKKYTEAEPFLEKGYEGLKQRAAKIPEDVQTLHLTEAAQRLVVLYEATDNQEKAARWRQELELLAAKQKDKKK
jgi:eukaryotic-like serine/threonine-protein kinase